MPICVHTGSGCPALTEMADSRYMRNFGQVRVLPLIAFHDIIFSRVPERHPGLKFGFIEASASWIPFLLHFLKRAAIRSGPRRSGRDASWIGPEMFEECCLYVACEADEDIPALARDAGWDHLLIGSDYGHGDQSSELDLVNKLNVRDDLSPEQMEKILSRNPATFYGLDLATL
jgi:predicted TIM-barrel fold metal-dependent hydrolase